MKPVIEWRSRRGFLGAIALGAAAFSTRGLFAEELVRVKTPAQTEGPFYPNKLPLDTDNDLLIVNDAITPAVGEVTHLSGKILDAKGDPIRNALVEIWQCDSQGVYIHTRCPNQDKRDRNFQGFGRFLTASSGEYYFQIKQGGKELLTTQCYIKGESRNDRDGVYRGIRDAKARDSVNVDFAPLKTSRAGELQARFDVVLGLTPEAG